MTDKVVDSPASKIKKPLRATHNAPVNLAGFILEGAILEDGRRGFIQKQLTQAVGFRGNTGNLRFARFLARLGDKSLIGLLKTESPVLLPNGTRATWTEWPILTKTIRAVIRAAADGKLTSQQKHIAERCQIMADALLGVAVVGLIDEATGYQYERAPDALQDLLSRLIRETARDWDRRFHPEFYTAVCRLFSISYEGQHRALPNCIGALTLEYVYESVMPSDIIVEIRSRRKSEKLHQWLKDSGLRVLERQIDRVTDLANASTDLSGLQGPLFLGVPEGWPASAITSPGPRERLVMLDEATPTVPEMRDRVRLLDEQLGETTAQGPELESLLAESRRADQKIMDTPATTPEEIAVRLEMIMDVMTTSDELSWWLDGMLKASIRDLRALH